MSYRDYLLSEAWRKRRAVQLKKEPKCFCCHGTYRLEVHHKEYKRLGAELDCDLRTLCHECHKKVHEIADTKYRRKKNPTKRRHLAASYLRMVQLFNHPK